MFLFFFCRFTIPDRSEQRRQGPPNSGERSVAVTLSTPGRTQPMCNDATGQCSQTTWPRKLQIQIVYTCHQLK